MSKLIDGQLFCAMVIEGALSIEEKKDEANELNAQENSNRVQALGQLVSVS